MKDIERQRDNTGLCFISIYLQRLNEAFLNTAFAQLVTAVTKKCEKFF